MLDDIGYIVDALDFGFLLRDSCPANLEVEDLENGGAYNAGERGVPACYCGLPSAQFESPGLPETALEALMKIASAGT